MAKQEFPIILGVINLNKEGKDCYRFVRVAEDKAICEKMSGEDAMGAKIWKPEFNAFAAERMILLMDDYQNAPGKDQE